MSAKKIETVSVTYRDTAGNVYRVPQRSWRKWSAAGRRAFNAVYSAMRDQRLFTHPGAAPVPTKHWRTTRWNAAWHAAEVTR